MLSSARTVRVIHVKHRVSIAILILPATAAGMRWWFLHRSAAPTSWQGHVEADDIKVLPTQQGRLSAVSVGHRDTGAECPALHLLRREPAGRRRCPVRPIRT
jgi:multidrug resistance efflux pump